MARNGKDHFGEAIKGFRHDIHSKPKFTVGNRLPITLLEQLAELGTPEEQRMAKKKLAEMREADALEARRVELEEGKKPFEIDVFK